MSNPVFVSVASWQYQDLSSPQTRPAHEKALPEATAANPAPGPSEEECVLRIQEELRRAREQWEAATQEDRRARDQKLAAALQDFSAQRTAYFRRVEAEVVHLSLAIARKIVRREAALDPTLLRGLVHVTLEDLSGQDNIRLRLPPEDLSAWNNTCQAQPALLVACVADPSLESGEVILETQAGVAHLGFEAQLKQVEQGFLDLLAQRPENA